MQTRKSEVLAAIQAAPAGLTTAELVRNLRSPSYAISSCVSKLAAYGAIERRAVEPDGQQRGRPYRWMPKEPQQ